MTEAMKGEGKTEAKWQAHYNPDVGWNIWQGDELVFTIFRPSSLEAWPGLEEKMAADKALASGVVADHQSAAVLTQVRKALEMAEGIHDRYCDRVGAADDWAREVHTALREALALIDQKGA